MMILIVCLFGVLRRFQHCTGHITTGSWKGRGNQYIEFARVVYCKLPTNDKQLPAFPLTAMTGIEPQPQRWEPRVLPDDFNRMCTLYAFDTFQFRTIPHWISKTIHRKKNKQLVLYIFLFLKFSSLIRVNIYIYYLYSNI